MENVIWMILKIILVTFLAVGGTFQGESWKRIGFTRQILDALPNPLHLCDSSWDPYTSTAGENYYMIYLGKEIKPEWALIYR